MPRIAESIEVVTTEDGRSTLSIDGKEFPWHIAERGVETSTPGRGLLRSASITILAERVEVRDERKK